MDELLYDRVRQLKEIEDRLHMIRVSNDMGGRTRDGISQALAALQADVKWMIDEAEADHAAF